MVNTHPHDLSQNEGPIVRFPPNEIHFNDPEFLDTVYPGPGRKTKTSLYGSPRELEVRRIN